MTSELKTYKEWNESGYYVNKGSKAIEFKDNVALFSKEQVTKRRRYSSYEQYDFDGEPYSSYTPERWSQMAKNSPGMFMDLHSYHKGVEGINCHGAYQRVYAYENLGGRSIY